MYVSNNHLMYEKQLIFHHSITVCCIILWKSSKRTQKQKISFFVTFSATKMLVDAMPCFMPCFYIPFYKIICAENFTVRKDCKWSVQKKHFKLIRGDQFQHQSCITQIGNFSNYVNEILSQHVHSPSLRGGRLPHPPTQPGPAQPRLLGSVWCLLVEMPAPAHQPCRRQHLLVD